MEYRPPKLAELPAMNTMMLCSKAHWGYDDAFMAACVEELTVLSCPVPYRVANCQSMSCWFDVLGLSNASWPKILFRYLCSLDDRGRIVIVSGVYICRHILDQSYRDQRSTSFGLFPLAMRKMWIASARTRQHQMV